MTSDARGDKFDRNVYGPRPLGAVLPAVLKPVYRKQSPASGQLLADWELIMGPALAAATTPRKLFSGTLVIVCSGPVAMELQYLADSVMARINNHFGRVVVTRLRFVQDVAARPAVARRQPRRLAVAAAERAVAVLPAGELRDALERLGRFVLTDRG
ncbi:MAG TPA: DUF721 domain-containing protein [Acetobacteraceae bacterium]|jgi:hypothetical protein|nr:DUF721 domain-containing protein [Acetobacteraceae bacterium]